MFKKNTKGMIGAIEIALIVIVLIVAGLIVWRVASGDKSESTNETVTEETTTEPVTDETSQVPVGWTTYTNEELGFSFSYPEEWGSVVFGAYYTGDYAKGAGIVDYNGEAWRLGFGNFELLTAALFSSDFEYTGLGFGVRQPYGVIDFDADPTFGEGLVEAGADLKIIAIAGMGVEFDGVSFYKKTDDATYPVFNMFYDAEDVEGIAATDSSDQYHPEQYVDQQVDPVVYQEIIDVADSFRFN